MSTKNQTWKALTEPAPEVNEYGTRIWYNKFGQVHRDSDRPAIIYRNGVMQWYQNGNLDRANGKPAAIWPGINLGKSSCFGYYENGQERTSFNLVKTTRQNNEKDDTHSR